MHNVVTFLNDQLTLIRKGIAVGHFNDLSIYQTTLGRYWGVPLYILTWKEVCSLREKKNIKLYCYKDKSYLYRARPYADSFINHYPDVFSKLTPLERE